MKSLQKYIKDKKGVLGIETATAFVLALLGLIVIGIAFVISIAALGDANIASDGSQAANATAEIVSNGTSGISTLFANTITWMTMLGVVITILIIVLLIVAIRRIEGAGTAGAAA